MALQVLSPILCMFAQYGFATILMATTARSPSNTVFALLILVFLLHIEMSTLPALYGNQLLEGPHAFFSLVRTVHIIYLMCFLEVDKHTLAKMSAGDSSKFLQTARLALRISTTLRGIGTIWEVKRDFPPFPSWILAKNGQIIRARFLLRQIAIVLWQYLFLDLLYYGFFAKFHELPIYKDAPGTEFVVYRDPTFTQIATRLIITLALATILRTWLDITYRCFSVVSVAASLTSPEEWPPLFGRFSDAYTFRRFWGKLWHQLLRWPIQHMSRFINHDILGFAPKTSAAAYSELVLIFTLSAALHGTVGVWINAPGMVGLAALLGITPLVIICEYWVMEYMRNTENKVLLQLKRYSMLCQVIGHLWVLFWLYLTGPWFAYPLVGLPIHAVPVIPYSIVGNFGLGAATLNAGASGLLLHSIFKLDL